MTVPALRLPPPAVPPTGRPNPTAPRSPLATWTAQTAAEFLARLVRDRLGDTFMSDGTAAPSEMSARRAGVTGLGSPYDVNYRLCELKDHWQRGILWVGPRGTPDVEAYVLSRVKPGFIPDDAVGEGLENIANGLVEREPLIEAIAVVDPEDDPARPSNQLPPSNAPGATEPPESDEQAEAMLRRISAWWDRVHFTDTLRKAVKRSQWAGRAAVYVRVPTAKLSVDANGVTRLPTFTNPQDAFDAIEADALLPDRGGIAKVLPTELRVGIVNVSPDDAHQVYQLWTVENGQTVLRVIDGARASAVAAGTDQTQSYPMFGRLPIAEMETDPLISPPIVRQQALLNFITTVLARVVETSGFPQTYTTNAKKEGIWTTEKPATPPLDEQEWGGSKWYLRAIPRTVGAGVQVDLVGISQALPDKSVRYETPGVVKFEATDPAYVTNARDKVRAVLFQQMKQRHLSGTATAEASGEAYEQARSQMESHLNHVRHPAEGLVRDTLEAVVALAGMMCPALANWLGKFRIQCTLHVDTGPLTAAEQQNIIALRDGRIISQRTAMARARIEDVSAEMEAILSDPVIVADIATKQAAAFAAWVNQTTEAVAGWLIGMTPEQVTALATQRLPQAAIDAGYPNVQPEPAPAPAPAPNPDPNAPPVPPPAPGDPNPAPGLPREGNPTPSPAMGA